MVKIESAAYPEIRVNTDRVGGALILQDGDLIVVDQVALPALISALQAALPYGAPPTVSKGDGA